MLAGLRPNISSSRARVPHSAGDFTPAGGGRCLPSVLNSWPMKPSGVQLARPILPPGLQTRSSSAAALSWSGVNITPKVETPTSKLPSANGSASASASRNSIAQPFGRGALAAALEQRRHVVGRGHVAPAARRRRASRCRCRRRRRAPCCRRAGRAPRTAPRRRSAAWCRRRHSRPRTRRACWRVLRAARSGWRDAVRACGMRLCGHASSSASARIDGLIMPRRCARTRDRLALTAP